jgi:hypothetical protein
MYAKNADGILICYEKGKDEQKKEMALWRHYYFQTNNKKPANSKSILIFSL